MAVGIHGDRVAGLGVLLVGAGKAATTDTLASTSDRIIAHTNSWTDNNLF